MFKSSASETGIPKAWRFSSEYRNFKIKVRDDEYGFHHRFIKVSEAASFHLGDFGSNDQINPLFADKDYPFNITLWEVIYSGGGKISLSPCFDYIR